MGCPVNGWPRWVTEKAPMHNLLILQLTSLLYTGAADPILTPARDCWERCCPRGHRKSGQDAGEAAVCLDGSGVRAGSSCPATPHHKQIHLTLPVPLASPRRLYQGCAKKGLSHLSSVCRREKSSLTCKHAAFVTPKCTNQFPDLPPPPSPTASQDPQARARSRGARADTSWWSLFWLQLALVSCII